MEKILIIANWKCNPVTMAEAKRLFGSMKKGISEIRKAEVVICPPFVYLPEMKAGGRVHLGAQDAFWEEKGAFTGEVSPLMLKNLGVKYVILGHSERRKYLAEADEMVNKKLKAVLGAGLKPILCVGSAKRGRVGNEKMKSQLKKALAGVEKSDIKNIVFTYEPVWAISTTKGSAVATPENTKEGAVLIRKTLAGLFGKSVRARVIYGGSVNSKNISGFIKEAKMEGVLIGAASLRPDDFISAVKSVVKI